MRHKMKRLTTFMEKSRTLYILLHLEPNGLRYSLLGHILMPLALGIQFIVVPNDRFAAPVYQAFTNVVSIDTIGWVWIGFSLWQLFIMRFVRRTLMGYFLVWSAAFYVFWAMAFGISAWETGGAGLSFILFGFMAWSLVSLAQSFIYRQINVNGPRSIEFQ